MPSVSDYFAELFVAGRFADAGWNVYFPHRDKGFDFIASKELASGEYLIRPVQVKGKYPTVGKTNKNTYGYVGRLSQLHPEMVLAIPFFSKTNLDVPLCIAYMPRIKILPHKRGFKCEPACFKDGIPMSRREYKKYFNKEGLDFLEKKEWNSVKNNG
jgi:hypothetical protein